MLIVKWLMSRVEETFYTAQKIFFFLFFCFFFFFFADAMRMRMRMLFHFVLGRFLALLHLAFCISLRRVWPQSSIFPFQKILWKL
jgi:hypothetical protein